tara:strand:- start:928 stop:1245 length:318 start_codon:yes stop_codon:yes gene_type:complete
MMKKPHFLLFKRPQQPVRIPVFLAPEEGVPAEEIGELFRSNRGHSLINGFRQLVSDKMEERFSAAANPEASAEVRDRMLGGVDACLAIWEELDALTAKIEKGDDQ